MEHTIQTKSIGIIKAVKGQFSIRVDQKYRSGLTNIDGFSHLQIVWWGSLFDQAEHRRQLINDKPYKNGPAKLGVFATRSQFRPNPILITTIYVENIDVENGIIVTPYIDAEDGTPLLDIKPYHQYEKVVNCEVPTWCSHWPKSYEDSAEFSWDEEFNF